MIKTLTLLIVAILPIDILLIQKFDYFFIIERMQVCYFPIET